MEEVRKTARKVAAAAAAAKEEETTRKVAAAAVAAAAAKEEETARKVAAVAAAAAAAAEEKKRVDEETARKVARKVAAAAAAAKEEDEARLIKDAMAKRDILLKKERERIKNAKAKKAEAEQEQAEQKKAEQKKAEQERAKKKHDEETAAAKRKAKQEQDKQEQDEKELAKQEQDKQENTKSSISNYFMKDNVDNIKKRFSDFVKECKLRYGKDATFQFTEDELKKIDKAVIKRAISEQSSIPLPTDPKFSIRTTNALIEVLGKTIKKKENVKELFDLNNIKITSREENMLFNKYFKNGINKKEILELLKPESKDNESENIDFLVNKFAGISKEDLTKLFDDSVLPALSTNEKNILQEKYFKGDKFNMEKLIELYGIK